ncbi:hypothetical protein [Caldicellulosiruptor naganoensis]|uniref:hypothetical protein n=1 Tax=Caldicellulosiruptor naganoensis TaxID=29324 RepID=UPI000AFC47EF|nr:hypothetical protein [Caldicellulosiruptor naganoensis]
MKVVVAILHHLHEVTKSLAERESRMHLPCYEEIFQNKYSQIKAIKNIIHQKEGRSTFDKYFLKACEKFEDRFAQCICYI